jgi:DNA repair exonuclease SbcCD nuclease subunit
MKFLQTSDIHIGECRSLEGYLARHRGILSQIIEQAKKRNLPVIIPGDLFHLKNTTYEERLLGSWFLGTLEEEGIDAIVTAGNHDHLKGKMTQIDDYRFMPFKHVKIIGWDPEIHIIKDTGFIGISWGSYTTENLHDIVMDLLPKIRHCKYKVVMVHECIVGSMVDNGHIMPKGTSALPNIPEVTYWAVGDIHVHQRINLPNAYYAGAPAQFKFDDVPRKGMIEVDLENPTAQPTFIPIRSKQLKTVSTVAEILEDAYYKVEGSLEEVLLANQHEKVVKTDWVRPETASIDLSNLTITDGLPNFLADRGLPEKFQKMGVEWVEKLLSAGTG